MIREGTQVKCSRGNGAMSKGAGTGKVAGRHIDDFARTPKGAGVKRRASEDEPAFLIRPCDGDGVPKSGGEIEKV